MGPMTLLRGLSADTEARHDRISEGVARLSLRATQTRTRVAARTRAARPALGALVGVPRRAWVSDRATTICVFGGLLLAPLLTVMAWIGLLLPSRAPLHHAAETLVVVAVVLLVLALVRAQKHSHRNSPTSE